MNDLPLCAPKFSQDTWIHYAETARTDDMNIELEEGYRQKCNEALHFAIDDAWVRTASDWIKKEYCFKYKLINFSELKLLQVNRSSIMDLLPLPLSEWGPDWKAIRQRGYDGVYIHHDEIYYGEQLPPGYNRWRVFVHNFDIDTLVVWRGAKIKQLTNDWPPLSDEKRVEKRKSIELHAQREAEREAKLATMTDEERRVFLVEEKRINRLSAEIRRTKNDKEVEELRAIFSNYDLFYPIRPHGVESTV